MGGGFACGSKGGLEFHKVYKIEGLGLRGKSAPSIQARGKGGARFKKFIKDGWRLSGGGEN